jgi:creatinine amidohydrolase
VASHTTMDITAEELRGMLQSKQVCVLQPVGNTEDHGPHLPLATDTLIAEAWSSRASTRTANSSSRPP